MSLPPATNSAYRHTPTDSVVRPVGFYYIARHIGQASSLPEPVFSHLLILPTRSSRQSPRQPLSSIDIEGDTYLSCLAHLAQYFIPALPTYHPILNSPTYCTYLHDCILYSPLYLALQGPT